MPAATAVALYRDLDDRGVGLWIDGGWGVDALLGTQTRPHGDLDVVVEGRHLDALVDYLRRRGYADVPKPDSRAWNFVLSDNAGHEVDIHVVTLAANGDGIYGPPENGDAYPAAALTGSGTIAGHPVRCTTAAFQVASHTGYPLGETDLHDVTRLCEKFAIPVPAEYRRMLATRP